MANKMSLSPIIRGHVSTLRNAETGKKDWRDYFYQFAIPLIVGIASFIFKVRISSEVASLLATCMSVFAALLFNLIVLILDMARKIRDRVATSVAAGDRESLIELDRLKRKSNLVKETNFNVGFEIILCVICLTLLMIGTMKTPWPSFPYLDYFVRLNNALTIAVSLSFLTILFMILKRLYVLLSTELVKEEEFVAQIPD